MRQSGNGHLIRNPLRAVDHIQIAETENPAQRIHADAHLLYFAEWESGHRREKDARPVRYSLVIGLITLESVDLPDISHIHRESDCQERLRGNQKPGSDPRLKQKK